MHSCDKECKSRRKRLGIYCERVKIYEYKKSEGRN